MKFNEFNVTEYVFFLMHWVALMVLVMGFCLLLPERWQDPAMPVGWVIALLLAPLVPTGYAKRFVRRLETLGKMLEDDESGKTPLVKRPSDRSE